MEDIKKGGVYCQTLQEIPAATAASDVFALLEKGVKNRTTAETALNENSSRSHSIFTIKLHTKESVPGGEDLLKTGTLNLVDLAGSECIGRSGARQARAREAGHINQSLLTLGRVITALVDRHPHVPYRDSKLTRLLQESLGGRAKTTIIATLAPCADCVDETSSTLDYAYRAKNIKNKPEVNQRTTKHALLKDYSQEIDELRDALRCAREKDGIFLAPAKFQEMQERLSGQACQMEELEDMMERKEQEMLSLQEQASTTEAELQEERENLLQTKQQLQSTSHALMDTKAALDVSNSKLKHARKTIDAFEMNEKQLLASAKCAANMFESMVDDNTALREKVAKIENIQQRNQSKTCDYTSKVHDDMDQFRNQLASHHTQLQASFDGAQETLEKTKEDASLKLAEASKMLTSLDEWMTQQIEQLQQARELHHSALKKDCVEFETWHAQHATSFEEKRNDLRDGFGQQLNRLQDQLQQQVDDTSTQLNLLLENVKHSKSNADSFVLSHQSKLAELGHLMSSSWSKHILAISEQQATRASTHESNKVALTLAISRMKESVCQMLDTFSNEYHEQLRAADASFHTSLSAMSSDAQETLQATDTALASKSAHLEEFRVSMQSSSDVLNSAIHELVNGAGHHGAENKTAMQDMLRDVHDRSTQLLTTSTRARSEIRERLAHVTQRDGLYQQELRDHASRMAIQHREHVQFVTEQRKASDSALQEYATSIQVQLENIWMETDGATSQQSNNLQAHSAKCDTYRKSLEVRIFGSASEFRCVVAVALKILLL